MKNLLNFLYKNNFFFVFLFLEFICILILIKNNGYQGSSLLNSSNNISAKVYTIESSAKEYLLLKDISQSKIKSIGKGEEEILNKCKNGFVWSDAEHSLNRRTEFKFYKAP